MRAVGKTEEDLVSEMRVDCRVVERARRGVLASSLELSALLRGKVEVDVSGVVHMDDRMGYSSACIIHHLRGGEARSMT
jgi:hypothetical protein